MLLNEGKPLIDGQKLELDPQKRYKLVYYSNIETDKSFTLKYTCLECEQIYSVNYGGGIFFTIFMGLILTFLAWSAFLFKKATNSPLVYKKYEEVKFEVNLKGKASPTTMTNRYKIHSQATELTLVSQQNDAEISNLSIRGTDIKDEKKFVNALDLKKNSLPQSLKP
jgi:hypothetical protein